MLLIITRATPASAVFAVATCLSIRPSVRHVAVLALVTRDLILAFPVTYLAKTRLNLL